MADLLLVGASEDTRTQEKKKKGKKEALMTMFVGVLCGVLYVVVCGCWLLVAVCCVLCAMCCVRGLALYRKQGVGWGPRGSGSTITAKKNTDGSI